MTSLSFFHEFFWQPGGKRLQAVLGFEPQPSDPQPYAMAMCRRDPLSA